MKRKTQRLIATCLVATGAITGLWVGVSFFKAQAQGVNENPPAEALPAPPAPPVPPGNPPEQVPPTAQDLPPPPEGAPAEMQGGPQDIQGDAVPLRTAVDGFIYNPEGLRDPFFPARSLQPVTPVETPIGQPTEAPEPDFDPKDPLQAFELREYRLVAVLWDVREPKAMVATPDNKVWTIRQKVRLGRAGAVVAAIRESEIVVVEPNPDGSYVNAATRVISIKK